MKKALVRCIVLALALSMTAMFAGCGSGGYSEEGDGKLTIFHWGMSGLNTARKSQTSAYQVLEDAAGLPIYAENGSESDWETQLSTKFGTEMLPDIFVSKGPESDLYQDMIEDEVLLPVSDYVSETEYPNIYHWLQNFDYLKTNLEYAEGKHYSIPVNWSLEHVIYVRVDWIENLNAPDNFDKNIAKENGVDVGSVTDEMRKPYGMPTNLLEFYRLAWAFTYCDPDGNGKDDTYGYTSALGDDLWTDNWIFNAFGAGFDFMIDDDGDGVYTSSWVTDGAKQAMNFINRMYTEGLTTRSSLENDMGSKQTDFMRGTAGMMEAHAWYNTILTGYMSANSSMTMEEAIADIAMIAPPAGPDGTYGIESNPNFWTVTCLNAHMSEEERTAALSLFDFLLSDEGQDFLTYGVKDVNYEEDPNGGYALSDGTKISIKAETDATTGLIKKLEDVDPAMIIARCVTWTLGYYSPFQTNSDIIIDAMELAKTYNISEDYPFLRVDSYNTYWEALKDYAEVELYNVVSNASYQSDTGSSRDKLTVNDWDDLATGATFDAFWSNYVSQYNSRGGTTVTNDYNAAVATGKYTRFENPYGYWLPQNAITAADACRNA